MKRFIVALLAIALMMPLASCGKTPSETGSDTGTAGTSEISSQTISDEPSSDESGAVSEEVSKTMPTEKNFPHVTGTFLQPYAFTSYTDAQWEKHFEGLLEVGIDLLVIQWTSTTPYSKFLNAYYPSEYAKTHNTGAFEDQSQMLERCLRAAENLGVKVYVGLNIADEWWDVSVLTENWLTSQAELGIISAKEIYNLYKEKYPNALAGWYFAWELYNGMMGLEAKAGEFLNGYLEPLTDIDPTMPLMLSPFVRSAGGDAVKAGEEWTRVFEVANFREGDIFCCQDAVGAGWITIDELDAYFRELKKAVDTEKGLRFWANNEDFTKDGKTAPLARFVRQMEISHPYVENHITFAYSHYCAKDIPGKAVYHALYKQYYDTGKLPSADIPEPTVSFKPGRTDDKVILTADVIQKGNVFTTVVILDADGKELKRTSTTETMQAREKLSLSFSLDIFDKYIISITDIYGNTASFPVENK